MEGDLDAVNGALARAVRAAGRADGPFQSGSLRGTGIWADVVSLLGPRAAERGLVSAPVTSVVALLSGSEVAVPVGLTTHAVERYVERVQPCADFELAVSQIARLFALGAVEPWPAQWDATRRPAPMYLTVGDVSFVLDVDARNRGALIARTCVTRGLRRSSTRRLRRRLRDAREERSGARPASARYRRPAPGQLEFEADDYTEATWSAGVRWQAPHEFPRVAVAAP